MSNKKRVGTTESKGWGTYRNRRLKEWRLEHPRPKRPIIPEININSADQIRRALNYKYPELNLTDANKITLEEISDKVPEVKLLLEMRKSQKIISTYGESLIAELDENDRLHAQYIQIKETSRMGASRIHQIPGRGELGKEIRGCFIPAEGNVFCIADYSQQEIRILAELSDCPRLLELFEKEEDVYAETIKGMLSLPESIDVKKEEYTPGLTYRELGKRLVFGIVYGLSPFGLANQIDIVVKEAEKLISQFFKYYPEVKQFVDENSRFAVDNLLIRTDSGWRRRFNPLPELPKNADTEQRREYLRAVNRIRRQGPNTRIQGLAASITKRSLIMLKVLKPDYVRIVGAIHDEIIIEGPKERAKEMTVLLQRSMDYGGKFYLKKVYIPPTQVIVADHWTKE